MGKTRKGSCRTVTARLQLDMWLCNNNGFVSVVADTNNSTRLMVRARRKQDLLNVCGDSVQVIENAGSDYRWRRNFA